jgi:hypothetical protein
MAETPEWKKITPQHLIPAVEHIRESFDRGHRSCSRITGKFCHHDLHPHQRDPKFLIAYKDALHVYLGVVGRSARKEFETFLQMGNPSAIFRAYFDLFYEGIRCNVKAHFDSVLKIGLANWTSLNTHPVAWAKSHLDLLIADLPVVIERWIKETCDTQAIPEPELISSNFDEIVFWRTWRAPKLIYMQPAGNGRYDAARAWEREDEPRTKELLSARSERFSQFLGISLEQIAGTAHVSVAQDNRYTELLANFSSQGNRVQNRSDTPKANNRTPPIEISALLPKYQSPIKRAILMQFLANPIASDLDICRGLDATDDVDLPEDWRAHDSDRLFMGAYRNPMLRPRIEVTISKIRGELRKRGLISQR